MAKQPPKKKGSPKSAAPSAWFRALTQDPVEPSNAFMNLTEGLNPTALTPEELGQMRDAASTAKRSRTVGA